MPNIFKTHALSAASLATQSDLNSAVITATPKRVKFAGLVLNIPFGKRGSTAIRSTAKGYGARYDGKEWTLPAAKYSSAGTAALDWFRTEGLIAGIKTREYTPWVWDGRATEIALDIPFADRLIAKQHGAKWDAGYSRWYLPKSAVTQAAVDALNQAEAIAGEIDNTGQVQPGHGQVLQQVSAAPTQPRPRPVQGVPRVSSPPQTTAGQKIESLGLLATVAERFLPFNLNIKNLCAEPRPELDGQYSTVVECMSAAEDDPEYAARTKHWLHGYNERGGVFVCFTEVPWFSLPLAMRQQGAIAVMVVETDARAWVTGGSMHGYHIRDFLTRGAVTLADSTSSPLQCVITREDAIRLYEDLANTVGFQPYQYQPDQA